MNMSYKNHRAKTFYNLLREYAGRKNESDIYLNQTLIFDFPNMELLTPLNDLLANFNNIHSDEKI